MPAMTMHHAVDPREDLLSQVGSLKGIETFQNNILVAIYKRPEKTKSGIILTDQNRDEDKFQSKVGLVLQMGPRAFVSDENWSFEGIKVEVGDWVVLRPSNGWALTLNTKGKVDCRIIEDTKIIGKISDPDMVW